MQEQRDIISGELYKVYDENSHDFKHGQMPRIGQRVSFDDGRKFVFCSTAVDVEKGELAAIPAPNTSATVVATTAAGLDKIELTLAGVTSNQFAGGQVTFYATRHSYKIKKNTASNASNVITLFLAERIVSSISTGSTVVLSPLIFSGLSIGGPNRKNVGVALVNILAATAGVTKYFWAQYRGVAYVAGAGGSAGQQQTSGVGGVLGARTTVLEPALATILYTDTGTSVSFLHIDI